MSFVDNIKEVVKIVQQIDNTELYRKLLDVQAEILEITEQLKSKDEKIKELEKALQLKGKMICENSAYFIVDENQNKTDGPFCTKCFDVDHIICRLINAPKHGEGHQWEWVQCPKCKVPFRSRKIGEYLKTH